MKMAEKTFSRDMAEKARTKKLNTPETTKKSPLAKNIMELDTQVAKNSMMTELSAHVHIE
jgi:hypothetical protein